MGQQVAVVGAGPVGCCAALALAGRGAQVEVIERQAVETLRQPSFDGREVALNHASESLLRDLGVWARIPDAAKAPLRRARVMDGRDPGFTIAAADLGKDYLGTLVSNHVIRQAAWEALVDAPRIRVHAGVALEDVTRGDPTRLQLADGQTLEANLLVAGDGRFSHLRRLFGIATHMHDFGQTMLLCRVWHDRDNDGTAWEWFGQGLTRALLPLGEHLSSAILTLPAVTTNTLLALSEEAFAARVGDYFEQRLGAVELASGRHAYPMVGTWARRFVGPRLALVGDAAVGMHPVTAHGFNLGLASVKHLADAVEQGLAQHGDAGHAAALARYQRRQRTSSALMFAGTQTVATLFTDDRIWARPLRKTIMLAGRHLPPISRALAVSLLDDDPRPASPLRHARRLLTVLGPRPGFLKPRSART